MAADIAVGIFNDAVSLSPDQRPEFLLQACAGDSRLVAEIRSLLAVHDAANDLPPLEVDSPGLEPEALLGPFQILHEIGRGGMGIVYLARDRRLHRQLAIKTLSPWLGNDPQRLSRLEREAQVLASLNHPNIGILHSLGESDGICYLVLEYVEGRTLAEELRSGPIAIPRALEICRQIADALSSAHRRGVVHRDLKPSNVMVTPESRVKLVDFGLATVLSEAGSGESGSRPPEPEEDHRPGPTVAESETRTSAEGHPFVPGAQYTHGVHGAFWGTPGYMSPEQLSGGAVDVRADIWSFGCILYECLSGRPAFPGDSVADRISVTLRGDPEWGSLPEGLPDSIRVGLGACLRPEPEDRPESIEAALSELLGPTEVEMGPTVAVSTVRGARIRNRIVASLVVVGVLVGVVGLFLFRNAPTDEPTTPVFRQLTLDGGVIRLAASRDGRRIAYQTEGLDLVLLDLDTGERTSRHLLGYTDLEWSPSGSGVLANVPRHLGGNVVQTRVFPFPSGEPQDLGPPGFRGMSWSPDGSQVVGLLTRVPEPESIAILDLASDDLRIVTLDEDIGRLENLRWSPSGRQFLADAFASGDRTPWIVGIEGGAPTRLPGKFAAWGPGGRSLLIGPGGATWQGLSQIRIDPVSGRLLGRPTQVCEIQQGTALSISEDGRRVFVLLSTQAQNLWRLDLEPEGSTRSEGSEPWTRMTSGTRSCQSPRISPDGTRVACLEGAPMGGEAALVLYDLVGSSQRPVTLYPSAVGNPAWSPDGTRVACLTTEEGVKNIRVVGSDGTEVHAYPQTAGEDYTSWIPGRGIVFQSPSEEDRNYTVLDPESGTSSTVFPEPVTGTAFQVRASPDGTRIAVAGNRGNIEDVRTWIIDLTTGSETLLVDTWAAPVGWSEDSDFVYIIGPDPRGSAGWKRSVFRAPASGGDAERIADLPGFVHMWGNVDVSPDGRTILCAVVDGYIDVWLTENLAIR